MISNAFEVTKDDVLIVLREHDTIFNATLMDEIMDTLDHALIESCALSHTDSDEQTEAALAEIEHQLIAEGFITEPYRFLRP